MRLLPRLLIAFALLALAPLPRVFGSATPVYAPLSRSDIRVGRVATRIAASSPTRAVRWLQQHRGIRAVVGLDRRTVEIWFPDHARLVILPGPTAGAAAFHPIRLAVRAPRLLPEQATPVKAAVIMPFANDLGEGANAGQAEIDALTSAGFSVDVYRNGEVTPDLLTHLADYSVVYLETHSTTLGDGDAILDTASTDNKKYVSYIKDGTVLQATAAGVSGLFLAITSQFILKHVGIFEPSTLLYFDGCDLLPATVFWSALESKGVGALVSWDSHVYSGASQNASQFMFGQFAHGESVATSIAAAESAGLANALGDKGIAHLGYLGDGDDTLARALAHYTAPPTATPTPTNTPSVTDTPTPTPTDIPTATPTPVTKKACPRNASKKHGKCTCKKGYKMVHGKCKKVKKKK